MGFIKKLFGGGKPKPYVDRKGLYFYAVCDHCKTAVRIRADKSHDLNNVDGGYAWHKTIVDARCFRPMQAFVLLDREFKVVKKELEGGHFISEAEYKAVNSE